ARVLQRPKIPYRAPIAEALTGPDAPAWAKELLDRAAVDAVGVFDGARVGKLVEKLAARRAEPSEADNMAVIAAATTQLLSRELTGPPADPPRAHLDAVQLHAEAR
ncbi:MAG TPA: asparagine synthase-related protein, partial [Myxococcales bacterium]|nr:asparagine synthase-related protein [Myxococcales bacterium]